MEKIMKKSILFLAFITACQANLEMIADGDRSIESNVMQASLEDSTEGASVEKLDLQSVLNKLTTMGIGYEIYTKQDDNSFKNNAKRWLSSQFFGNQSIKFEMENQQFKIRDPKGKNTEILALIAEAGGRILTDHKIRSL